MNNSLRYEQKSLVAKLESLKGSQLEAVDENEGWYKMQVKPFSVKYVTDLIDVHLGRGNYEIKYDALKVTWIIEFNVFGKGRLTV